MTRGKKSEKLVDLGIVRDGPIWASDLEEILNITFTDMVERVEESEARIRRLEREVETERRLRLAMGVRR